VANAGKASNKHTLTKIIKKSTLKKPLKQKRFIFIQLPPALNQSIKKLFTNQMPCTGLVLTFEKYRVLKGRNIPSGNKQKLSQNYRYC
jgi:hypothetical protein